VLHAVDHVVKQAVVGGCYVTCGPFVLHVLEYLNDVCCAFQPVSSSGPHLDVSVPCDSVVKSENVPSVSSLTAQPVAELVACTINDEKLSHMEKKCAVGAEQSAVPVTLVLTIAGQHPSSYNDGASLSWSSSVVPSLVVSTTDSANISPSVFCPAIVDVSSLKMEPEDDNVVSKPSSAVSDQPCVPRSNSSYLKCDMVENATASSVHRDNGTFHLNNMSNCITSDCSSSLSVISSSEVSVRPLMSVAGSLPSEMTSTRGADKSVASAVVKQEFSSAMHSCLSSAKQSSRTALQPDSVCFSARNSTDIPANRSTQFTGRTAQCSETGAKDVVFSKSVVKSEKNVDIVSALDMALVHTDSRKHIYSKAADIDSAVKDKQVPSAAKWKCDAESGDSTMPPSKNESKSSSLISNVESKKRKSEPAKFTGRTAQSSETGAEDVVLSKPVKSVDIVSALDMALVHTDSRKRIYSKAADIDSTVKGKQAPSAAKRKRDAESSDSTVPQSRNESKLSSLTLNVESRKRKSEPAKTGVYVYSCVLFCEVKIGISKVFAKCSSDFEFCIFKQFLMSRFAGWIMLMNTQDVIERFNGTTINKLILW